jgi:hypothetical protein
MTNQLTKIFKAIGGLDTKKAALDVKKESLGAEILAYLVEKGCKTLSQANEQFDIAKQENGWTKGAGRPKAGSKDKSVPPTVKNYITYFRRAYEAQLDVLRFKTVGEMRAAVAEMRTAQRELRDKPESLIGVQVTKDDVLTGNLVHDIYACIKALSPEDRDDIEVKLRRVLAQAVKKAPPELKLVA